jgi:hypothetical protein
MDFGRKTSLKTADTWKVKGMGDDINMDLPHCHSPGG